MRIRGIGWTLMFGMFCGALAFSGRAVGQELGDGRGIDHVGMLVRPENFAADAKVFRQLGFTETPVLTSDAGVENRLIWFRDLSYLEIDSFTQSNPGTAPFLDFLAHHEGAKFYGTEVLNAAQAVAFLTGAGYPNVGPIPAGPLTVAATGQQIGLIPLWNEIILTSNLAPDNSNFFLDYNEVQIQRMFATVPSLAPHPHANTAQKIDTLWLVVSDLDAAVAYYQGLGLDIVSRNRKVGYLGARVTEVQYNKNTLALLVPDGPGIAADFAADRGEGVLGVSLKVGSLDTAHDLIEGNTGRTLPIFSYRGRQRFLIPASLTHGVLLEMVE
ncbi:MAG TPA: VOC family protein [Thermoanaerobaculia bacterium]|nr:VOC family protein [Thermoanaerobaculia bacterium]